MVKVSLSNIPSSQATYTRITGITALLALGILENIQEQGLSQKLLDMEHNSPEYLHTLIEALRLVVITSFLAFHFSFSLQPCVCR